jgi:hypothetical protein
MHEAMSKEELKELLERGRAADLAGVVGAAVVDQHDLEISLAPAPDHVRFVTFTPETPPAGVSVSEADASTVTDPQKFQEYQQAQNQLSGALGRLLVTVERYPELVRRELAAGMAVGSHSYGHPQPFDRLPAARIRDEIAQGRRTLQPLGVHPVGFRPPGGATSPTVTVAAQEFGDRTVLWSVDPADWQPGVTANQLVWRVLAGVRPGAIVLLHDGGGDRSATVAALPAIIDGLRRLGLTLTLVPG